MSFLCLVFGQVNVDALQAVFTLGKLVSHPLADFKPLIALLLDGSIKDKI